MSQRVSKSSPHLVGYCTNVHAGTSLPQIQDNLLQHATAVRRELLQRSLLESAQPLPVGLWLSNQASQELETDQLAEFRLWLTENRFLPYTLNGFPYDDFHQDVVKHAVYQPTWAEASRLEYTVRLARILSEILPVGESGTISTLPIGWPAQPKDRSQPDLWSSVVAEDRSRMRKAASNLKSLAKQLDSLYQQTGRLIQVCLEPEPGCLLDTAEDVVCFFQSVLFDEPQTESLVRQHIGVCHDVCHSAVMFEAQSHAIEAYCNAGISIGKVQVSAAVEARGLSENIVSELQQFSEPRYLHQTMIQSSSQKSFFEDLPRALLQWSDTGAEDCLRVHFHVPIFLSQLGRLYSTQNEIHACLTALKSPPADLQKPQFEIETYAWNVLPETFRIDSLAMGIAQEIEWFQSLLNE